MRPSRVWYNRVKPQVQQHGYARESYERTQEAVALCKYATNDGFVAEIRGGFVHVATKRVVELSGAVK